MSRSQKPRTPRCYPRMKVRGAKRKRLRTKYVFQRMADSASVAGVALNSFGAALINMQPAINRMYKRQHKIELCCAPRTSPMTSRTSPQASQGRNMQDTDRAVERLTRTHTVHFDGAEYECAALLEQLREALTSSLGAGSGGGSGDGGLINVAAFTLWENIDGVARAWLQSFGIDHRGDLREVMQRLPAAIQAAHVGEAIGDELRERLDAMFAQWVAMIEDLLDPPRVKELTAPCPKCGERYDEDGDTRRAAVVVPVKPGRAIVAECRCCGGMWGTEAELLALAAGMGTEVDFVTLREHVNSSN